MLDTRVADSRRDAARSCKKPIGKSNVL